MSGSLPEKAAEKLQGYPAELRAEAATYFDTADANALDRFVYGVLEFLMPSPPEGGLAREPGDRTLREDLAIDSITIAEAVFLFEDIFEVSISNEDLSRIATLDDLRSYLHAKVKAG